MTNEKLHIVECPRDAMQGWPHAIATADKIGYMQNLVQVGFDTIDCGSFVSPKAIPQMADTAEVLQAIDLKDSASKLLVIVANERGAEQAVAMSQVNYMGFPFSVSPTFQQRNTNAGMEEAVERLNRIQHLAVEAGKELVVYLSMGFGNPYGDVYSPEMVIEWGKKISDMGVKILSLADTVGLATPPEISTLVSSFRQALPHIETGVHLHATPMGSVEKLAAAYDAGCRRFDSAIAGIGGCPMAGDDLTGNMDTATMLDFFESRGEKPNINRQQFDRCVDQAKRIFI
jgi:hydroxymethylglutaryl-CoA lyase